MDRRQKKTREAIFHAFIELLAEKNVGQITVSEIIRRANIGRATFYDHFETKDFLTKELCEELFCHIFDSHGEGNSEHRHIFSCNAPDNVFLHLFQHFHKNDNHILDLLSGQNNDLFLNYFKRGLTELVRCHLPLFKNAQSEKLPTDFWIKHIANTFIETIRWWLDTDATQPPDVIHRYFMLALGTEITQ